MPVYRTIFGRSVNIRRLPPRRLLFVLILIATFTVLTFISALSSSIPSGPSLSDLPNPLKPAAHKPPSHDNNTDTEFSWLGDWKWLRPFSSSITFDENKSILPPEVLRPPVYTFYDISIKKDEATKAAESKLLLVWRRAWWAQGFKPIILGRAEAMNNPLYETLQTLQLDAGIEMEMARWLAWEHMGGGVLANYLTVPMASREDTLLSFLRRGEYLKLTRYENLGNGLFSSDQASITLALKMAIENPDLKNAKSLIDALPAESFDVDPQHDGVAFYDSATITSKYKVVADKLNDKKAEGLAHLARLINSHLHITWMNLFSSGIAVLKPLPERSTAIIEPAKRLAFLLSQCPKSPMVASCPPNRPKCRTCVSSRPMRISTPQYFRNTTTLYTIGTVPHPYTTTAMVAHNASFQVPFVRREMKRDQWLLAATQELMGSGMSGAPRVVRLKETVAGQYGSSRSVWMIAEREMPTDLDWHFGFAIPENATDRGTSETPVPGPERRPKPQGIEDNVPSDMDLMLERALLRRCKVDLRSRVRAVKIIRDATEAWNLADTEIWKFVRAYNTRARMDRRAWEEEEKKFAGGAGQTGEGTRGWERWLTGSNDEDEE
jgi:hypothetical protein